MWLKTRMTYPESTSSLNVYFVQRESLFFEAKKIWDHSQRKKIDSKVHFFAFYRRNISKMIFSKRSSFWTIPMKGRKEGRKKEKTPFSKNKTDWLTLKMEIPVQPKLLLLEQRTRVWLYRIESPCSWLFVRTSSPSSSSCRTTTHQLISLHLLHRRLRKYLYNLQVKTL